MRATAPSDITHWIRRLGDCEAGALERVVPLLYDELRRLARSRLTGERDGHTLGTTGLVHEAYLRLRGQRRITVQDRAGFFAVAATTMRRVLVDYARGRRRLKRNGGQAPLSLDDVEPFLATREAEELLALDRALERLTECFPRAVKVVEHRLFGGLSLDETAGMLGVGKKTVQRDWAAAMAWLRKEVAGTATRGRRPEPLARQRSAA